jgi:hypothetical protein
MSPENTADSGAPDKLEQPPFPTIKSVEPGVDKSLEFHKVKDGTPPEVDDDKVRLTIVNEKGDKESIVLLYGDVNMALSVLGHNPAQAGGGGVPIDGPIGGPTPVGEPNNEGENLDRTPTNPELDPHQPGVEPEDAPVNSGPNAPATTDPEGDTAKQNAPEVPAPEPDGPNVTTNPGTDSTSDAQTEVPQPEQPVDPGAATDSGAATDAGDVVDGQSQEPTEPEPQPTVPAESVSEKPLYVDVTEDRSATWSYTPPFHEAGLVTPDGRPLYHYEGDVDGEPGKGAKDGTIGIYADEVVAPTPEENVS